MRIFYAVQATGNGHISRAIQLLPYLKQFGEVDIFLSGSNSSLSLNHPIKYRSKGLSLYFKECGEIDIFKSIRKADYFRIIKESKSLPVDQYDLVINDFEHITAKACQYRGVPSVQFGHQASFMSKKTPRASKRSIPGEYVLANYARATSYVGLHFKKYDDFIFEPIIKERIINATPRDRGHVTVYLPSYLDHCIRNAMWSIPEVEFHWFVPGIKEIHKEKNIKFFPIDNHLFSLSMKDCHGIITGGGFETPSEALYLEKKLLSIPIKNHYEQLCNAAALKEMGVPVIDNLKEEKFEQDIRDWLDMGRPNITIRPNVIRETLEYIVENYSVRKNLAS